MHFRAVFCAVFLSIALGVFQSVAGEPSAPTNTSSTPTNTADDFDTLVKRGDQARLESDYITAIKAYRDALALRKDGLIEGRLGLLLFEARAFDVAAQHLQHAVETSSNNVSDAEFARFSSAFRAAQKQVCRIDIEVDRRGTRLEVDGDFIQEGKGEFWFFVVPGKHTLRVTLDGFEEEIREIDAPKGDQRLLKFVMRPKAKPALEPEKLARPEPALTPKASEPTNVSKDKPPSKTNTTPKGWFVLGGGVALVLGPTPNPALGPQIFGAWRSRTWWEVGLDARVGWMVAEDKRLPGAKFTAWSVGLTPCARVRDRFFGCVLAQMDGVGISDDTRASVLPGLGLRAGIDIPVHKRVRIQVWADATAHPGGFEFQPHWRGSFITGSIGTRGVMTF